jgi:TonB family protein
MRLAKSQAISIALHIGLMAAMVWLGSRSPSYLQSPVRPAKVTSLSAPRMRIIRLAGEARSGGGNRGQLPARRGDPPPPAHKTFVLPDTAPHPALPLLQTIAFTGPAPQIDSGQTGDPFSLYPSGAFGFGGEGSIGDGGCCGGVGPGKSGSPGYSAEQLSRMTPPRLLYRVEPEFSEEARKAKYQGVVVLYIDIDTKGRARNIRVARQLGLGLDEKAVEAVSEWRFRPAYLDGKPVVASAVVEVNFHLL